MKELMLGNAAVARGLYEAGCRFVSSYPGTPSTEITEVAADYDEIYAEWAANEKVALESAVGASLAGARSFTAMKHVGLNVAAETPGWSFAWRTIRRSILRRMNRIPAITPRPPNCPCWNRRIPPNVWILPSAPSNFRKPTIRPLCCAR